MKVTRLILALILSINCWAKGNTHTRSFNKAVKDLEHRVYNKQPKTTIYCKATFNGKQITNPNGFVVTKYKNRANKLEWEHVVAAEHFGQFFDEWHNNQKYKECTKSNGEKMTGRECASKLNQQFQYMQADMYNLYPAIGAVNALRSNMKFAQLKNSSQSDTIISKATNYINKWTKSNPNTCSFTIEDNKIEPSNHAKGKIARCYLYMSKNYSIYRLSSKDKHLFKAWNNKYPITANECRRTKLIEQVQRNVNHIVKDQCIKAKLW